MNGKRRILALGLLTTVCASAQQSFDPDYAAGEATPLAGAGPHPFVYYEKGEGTPIVFSAAPVADQRWWQLQIEPFAERYRAVAFGGGAGAASAPDDLIVALEMLREKLGVQRINLVAHSMGARIAMELAIERPDLFKALVLEEPAWSLPERPQAECGLEDPDPVDLETCLFMSIEMGPGRFESLPDAMRGYILEAMGHARNLAAEAGLGDEVGAEWQPREICEELGELDLPILVVRGEDTPAHFQAGYDYYEQCLPPHETAFIPNATHMAHFENPEAYNRAVMAFFDQIGERSTQVSENDQVLVGVTVIDGTGAAPRPGQTVASAKVRNGLAGWRPWRRSSLQCRTRRVAQYSPAALGKQQLHMRHGATRTGNDSYRALASKRTDSTAGCRATAFGRAARPRA